MAITSISDIIEPKTFQKYQRQRAVNTSRFAKSGIMVTDAEINTRINDQKGGRFVELPFFNDIGGDSEVIVEGVALTPAKLGTGQDRSIIHNRGKQWDTTDLSHLVAGEDPARAIADFTGDWWMRQDQKMLLSTLKGIFASGTLNANKLHIHHTSGGAGSGDADNFLNAETFIAAKQCLGDRKESLVGIAMHSAVEAWLERNNAIDFVQDSEGGLIKYYRGVEVFMDDDMPSEVVDGDAVYTSYLFAKGAVAFDVSSFDEVKEGMAPGSTWGVEFVRDAGKSQSGMINRRRFICHVRGVKWNDGFSIAGPTPTNAEVENASAWTRVYDPKLIRVVQMKYNIG